MKHFYAAAFIAVLLAASPLSTFAQSCPDDFPRSQGYWKNHAEAWPILVVTVGDDEVGRDYAIDNYLKQPTRGSGAMILLRQLIPAQLNIAAGVDGAAVQHYIDDAHDLLADHMHDLDGDSDDGDSEDGDSNDEDSSDDDSSDEDSDRQKMIDIAERLDEFNNGLFCSLPVELTTFDAQANGTAVTLRWSTASEENNAGFEIEHRRGAGYGFAAMDFVAGNGSTAAENTYSARFANLGFGKHTFRLRQVDLDGKFSYSPEVEIDVALTESFALTDAYPNPFNPTTNIRFSLRESGEINLAVYDIVGRRVKTLAAGTFAAGSHDVTFNAGNLPSGTYLYRLQTLSGPVTGTLVLLK